MTCIILVDGKTLNTLSSSWSGLMIPPGVSGLRSCRQQFHTCQHTHSSKDLESDGGKSREMEEDGQEFQWQRESKEGERDRSLLERRMRIKRNVRHVKQAYYSDWHQFSLSRGRSSGRRLISHENGSDDDEASVQVQVQKGSGGKEKGDVLVEERRENGLQSNIHCNLSCTDWVTDCSDMLYALFPSLLLLLLAVSIRLYRQFTLSLFWLLRVVI